MTARTPVPSCWCARNADCPSRVGVPGWVGGGEPQLCATCEAERLRQATVAATVGAGRGCHQPVCVAGEPNIRGRSDATAQT